MKKRIRLWLSLLIVCALSLTSCHALGPALSVIDSLVNDSSQVLSVIETVYDAYQAQHPVSAEDRVAYDKLLAEAHRTLHLSSRVLTDAEGIDQGQYDAATADFKTAFLALEGYLKSHGITPVGSGLVGAGPGSEDFPQPRLIGYRVQ